MESTTMEQVDDVGIELVEESGDADDFVFVRIRLI
jgi:hypothetical protein